MPGHSISTSRNSVSGDASSPACGVSLAGRARRGGCNDGPSLFVHAPQELIAAQPELARDTPATEEGNEIKSVVPQVRGGLEVASALALLPHAETLTERGQPLDIDTRPGVCRRCRHVLSALLA